MILDYKKASNNGEIIIPPFHNGHLGFMPGNYVSISIHYSNRDEEGFRDCELFIDQFQTNNSQQLFRLDCTLKDKPGVVQKLLNAISFFEINIVSQESSAIDSMEYHHISMILDWNKSNCRESIEISPSAKRIYGHYNSLFANGDGRYLELFEKIVAFCGKDIKIKNSFPDLKFTPYDIAKVELTSHFHKIEKYKRSKVDKFHVAIELPNPILQDIKRSTGYGSDELINYIPLSDTDKKFLRVFVPKKSRSEKMFHIGFSHLDEPGALSTITKLVAMGKFNIYSCLLRRDSSNENFQEKRNIWEAILEYRGTETLPSQSDNKAKWVTEILKKTKNPRGKKIRELANHFNIFIGPPKYPKRNDEYYPLRLVNGTTENKRYEVTIKDYLEELDLTYNSLSKSSLNESDSIRFDMAERTKKQINKQEKSIFLSYSYTAKNHADLLKNELIKHNFKPIELQETPPGKDITNQAIDKISTSDYFIGIWHHEKTGQEEYSVSPWMPFEFGVARTLKKKIILIVSEKLSSAKWNRIDSGTSKIQYGSLQFINETIPKIIEEVSNEWK